MKTKEIRTLFLEYFESKDHQRVESSSLVPANDPTLLFTNAGMVQFKDLFLGLEKRNYLTAVSSQRCVRAGGKHNDLENVGYTTRHHTFFEMLGNFSFGDYFKEEAISYAWEFITEILKIDPMKLWITVYEEDEEAARIWLEKMHIDEDRLIKMGSASNFWSMGDTGPCGPCTEIFYDHGEGVEGGPPGSENEDGDRFVEIWNLVFMQFERMADGTMNELPKPSVDTGMGLERIAAVMQGVESNYDIDIFKKLIANIKEIIGSNGSENHYRVIADHIRSSVFLIMDGISPGNEGRGYVLRRIIRRALRHGHEVGAEIPFFHRIVEPLIEEMGTVFPGLIKKEEYIKRIILMEEERFSSTLSQGMKLLNQEIDSNQGEVLSGEFVFKLYDTYGFPIDLTKDIVKNHGLDIDQEGFDAAMAKQKSMARKANQFSQEENIQLNHQLKTLFLGYDQLENHSKVIGIFKERALDAIKEGEMGQIIIEETAFYAESGGQIGDVGTIVSKDGTFNVIDTQHSGNAQVHIGSVSKGSISLGDEVKVSINPIKRSAITSNHTGTHLLHSALMKILGEHVTQRGSLVDDMKIRFDFSHDQAVSSEQIREIEAIVNSKIEENIEVETSIMKHDEAIDSGAMALFGEKYGDDVRVLEVGKFSKELCGGTHVKNTNEISLFKVVSESSVSSGTRRIEAITGDQALKWAEETEHLVEQLTDLLKIRREDVAEKVTTLVETNRKMSQEIKDLKARVAGSQDNENSVKPEIINGISLIIKALDDDTEAGIMRTAIDQMKNNLGSGVIVLSSLSSKGKMRLAIGVTQDLKETIPANELAKEMSEALGGKGGGRSDFANAGGPNPENMDEAISILKDRLENKS